MTIAVLFARADSLYKRNPLCDVYDEQRDALTWPGGARVIAHPPCREWGRLHRFSKAPPHERQLAIWAVWVVRRYGGVVEHPAASKLWDYMKLPAPGAAPDVWGGHTVEIRQCDFGHPAEKLTWLYVVRGTLPSMPPRREPTHVVKPQGAASADLHAQMARGNTARAHRLAVTNLILTAPSV